MQKFSFYSAQNSCLLVFCAGLLLLSGCGSSSSAETPPTLTAQAEHASHLATQVASGLMSTYQAANAQVTATAQAFQVFVETAKSWPPVMVESFDKNVNGWSTGAISDTLGASTFAIIGGKYRWDAQASQGLVWWSIPEITKVTDFYAAVDNSQLNGPSDSLWGLIFRKVDDKNYYVFQIDQQGHYALYAYYQDNWETLLPWTESPSISSSQFNRLAVVGKGTDFWLFVNDQFVAESHDDRLTSGQIGLLIGLNHPGDKGIWEFDNLDVRVPPPAATENPPTPE
jgi:hypothetical protein